MTAPAADRGYIRPEIEHLAVPLTDVRPYPGNARSGDHDRIRDSLATHGQYKPLLVQRSTGYVVAGNNTWEVMRRQGFTHAAVLHLDLDDDTARRMLLIDNRSSDEAGYDSAALADLLADIPEFDGTGWTALDLDALLNELDGGVGISALPDVAEMLPADDTGPALPGAPTADPPPAEPDPPAADPPAAPAAPPPPGPPAEPVRTVLPTAGPPAPRGTPPAPDADVPWHLTLTRADRDEALRLVGHARDWLQEPGLTPGDVVMRALRTLAAVGDARHNTTATVSVTALIMAAGRDPLGML